MICKNNEVQRTQTLNDFTLETTTKSKKGEGRLRGFVGDEVLADVDRMARNEAIPTDAERDQW